MCVLLSSLQLKLYYYKSQYTYLHNKTSNDSHLLLFTTYSIMEQITLLCMRLACLYILMTLLIRPPYYQHFYDIEDYIWIILTKEWDKPFQVSIVVKGVNSQDTRSIS